MGQSVSASLIDRCIEQSLGPELRRAGYVKKGRTYYLALDHCVLLVNVQGSQWNSGESARFTLNLAVHFPEGPEKIRGRLPLPLPRLHKVSMQVRIGILMPKNNDHWWELSTASPMEPTAAEVLQVWQKHGRPWLDWAAKP
jgi:hypothetical protein